MAAARRRSPSGPKVAAERLRWYGVEPGDSAGVQTGGYGRGEENFSAVADPASNIEQLEEVIYAVQTDDYKMARLVVQRLPGDPNGATVPSGDDPITIQLQSFEFAVPVGVQTDIGAPLTFGPAEFGEKEVDLQGAIVPAGQFLFVRATYPANWIQGDQAVAVFPVVDVLT